jgi:catechol 2,3-dioxygenase-like lactoylglutathione lyase family enzyme
MGTATSQARAASNPGPTTVDMKLEAIVIPVADVDRSKRFYEGLGWRLDADFPIDETLHVVQMTSPGSACSIHFGKGVTTATPGSAQGMLLAVADIDAARADLIAHGADVSETFHYAGIAGPPLPGPDPERGSYRSWASFSDPDGNGWRLQEITSRLPGRGLSRDVATLTQLLREAEQRHGEYEAAAPKHHWSGWYAAFIVAREQGRTPEESARDAALHMDRTRETGRHLS